MTCVWTLACPSGMGRVYRWAHAHDVPEEVAWIHEGAQGLIAGRFVEEAGEIAEVTGVRREE